MLGATNDLWVPGISSGYLSAQEQIIENILYPKGAAQRVAELVSNGLHCLSLGSRLKSLSINRLGTQHVRTGFIHDRREEASKLIANSFKRFLLWHKPYVIQF